MAQQDDELMFSVGVMERPDTKARLDAIAKSIDEAQARFSAGAVSIADSVTSVKSSITGVVDQVRAFGGSAASSYSLITASIANLRSAVSQPITQTVSMVVDSGDTSKINVAGLDSVQTDARAATKSISDLQAQAAKPTKVAIDVPTVPTASTVSVKGFGEVESQAKAATDSIAGMQAQAAKPTKLSVEMPDDLKAMFDDAGAQIEGLRDKAAEGVEVDFGLPKNLKNVFMEFSDVSIGAVNQIEGALEKKIGSLAEPMSIATAQIRQEYQKRVADQAKAYSKMSEDMDKAVNRQMLASEMQGEAVKRAAHGLLAGVKGFVQLGLVSEDSSEKILKGLVAIEGATSMLGGGVDVLSALSKGWRSIRQSTDAANKVAQISAAMAGPQFLQLRAYHAQLLQETVAANAAATANMRLAASRGGSGKGIAAFADGAGSLVDGAKQVSGLASKASTGGVAAAAGTAVKAGSSLAPVAVAGVGVGAGIAITIAAAAAALAALSLVAVELSETFKGTATKAGSVTDTIASSQVSLLASAMRMTGMFERSDSVGTQFVQSMSRNVDATLGTIPVIGRLVQSMNSFGDVAAMVASSAAVQRAEKRLAIAKIQNEGQDKLDNVNRDAGNEIATMSIKSKSIGIRDRAETGTVNDKLQGEMQIQALAAKELAKYQRQAADAANEQGRTSEKYRDSIAMVKTIQDQITDSYHKQKSLVGEKARAELQSQSQIAEGLKRQLDQTMQGIESVKGGYKSAALNFAKLGDIEKEMAIDALSVAKTKGAGALDESQRDILRSVGGKQATDFADQADLIESKKAGFDQSFGQQFDREGLQLESTKRTLEAQIQANYSTTVKVDFDSKLVVQSVVDEASKIIAQRNAEMTLAIQEGLQQQEGKIRAETQSRLVTQRTNQR